MLFPSEMKKPPHGRLGAIVLSLTTGLEMVKLLRFLIGAVAFVLVCLLGASMSYTDFMWTKACVVIGIVGIYAFWEGFTGKR